MNFRGELRRARRHKPEPGTIADLVRAQRIARAELCVRILPVLGQRAAELLWALRAREDELVVLARRIAELDTYTVGTFGQQLGVNVDTPCCVIASGAERRRRQLEHLGPPPVQHRWLRLCHRCDNADCAAADHVFWGTQQDNMRDMVLKQRARRARVDDPLEHLRSEWTARIAQLGPRVELARARLLRCLGISSVAEIILD